MRYSWELAWAFPAEEDADAKLRVVPPLAGCPPVPAAPDMPPPLLLPP